MVWDSNLDEQNTRNITARILQSYGNFREQEPQTLHVATNCLNGGEISPELMARFDQQRCQNGCQKLLNMVPLPTGGITKRPGFLTLAGSHFVDGGEGADTKTATRLVPFVFSQDQSRMLEFVSSTDAGATMRVWMPEGYAIGPLWQFHWLNRHNIMEMTYCQSADVIFLAHPSFPPLKLCRYDDRDWRLEQISWLPSIDPPRIARGQVIGSPPSGENSRVTQRYVATAIDARTGEESLPCEAFEVPSVPPLSQTLYVEIEVAPQEGVSEYRIYKRFAGVYGFIGRIPATGPNAWLVCEDRNIQADTEDTPPGGQNPFEGEGNYPAVVFLHQQRLGYAASPNRPLTVWLSQAGNFESMAASVPPRDDDAIEATLAANAANKILWCVSDRSGLAIGTQGGEWTLTNGEDGAITPSTLSFNPQTWYGSQDGLPAIRAGSSLLFPQRGAFAIREFGYSFANDRYESPDLSVMARHIFRNGNHITSWAWQPEPFSILWLARKDGTFASLTLMREHEVIAWATHETAGKVESFAALPDRWGKWQIWAIVRRVVDVNGQPRETRFVERLHYFFNSSSGHFEPEYLMDGNGPSPYKARCVPILPDSNFQNGTSFLRARKINAIKARVYDCSPFLCQIHGKDCKPSPLRDVPARGAPFSHEPEDWACPIGAGFRDHARLELIFDGPDPASLLGITTSLELAGEAGGQL